MKTDNKTPRVYPDPMRGAESTVINLFKESNLI